MRMLIRDFLVGANFRKGNILAQVHRLGALFCLAASAYLAVTAVTTPLTKAPMKPDAIENAKAECPAKLAPSYKTAIQADGSVLYTPPQPGPITVSKQAFNACVQSRAQYESNGGKDVWRIAYLLGALTAGFAGLAFVVQLGQIQRGRDARRYGFRR